MNGSIKAETVSMVSAYPLLDCVSIGNHVDSSQSCNIRRVT